MRLSVALLLACSQIAILLNAEPRRRYGTHLSRAKSGSSFACYTPLLYFLSSCWNLREKYTIINRCPPTPICEDSDRKRRAIGFNFFKRHIMVTKGLVNKRSILNFLSRSNLGTQGAHTIIVTENRRHLENLMNTRANVDPRVLDHRGCPIIQDNAMELQDQVFDNVLQLILQPNFQNNRHVDNFEIENHGRARVRIGICERNNENLIMHVEHADFDFHEELRRLLMSEEKVTYTDRFVGRFEIHKYDKKGKNNWHYVNIAKHGNYYYVWKNAAGVQWKLYPYNKDTLRVGTDCPYYKSGHKYAKFSNGGVYGPWNEFYQHETCEDNIDRCSKIVCSDVVRKSKCATTCQLCDSSKDGDVKTKVVSYYDKFTGFYECHKYDDQGKNRYHYVTIAKHGNSYYIWKNAAGVQWKLYPYNKGTLRVGKDCPYYKIGHKYAKFSNGGVYGPWNEFYKLEDPMMDGKFNGQTGRVKNFG